DIEALRKRTQEAFKGELEGPKPVDLVRPDKELYVQFHPDPGFYLDALLWTSNVRDERRRYYVDPSLYDLEDLKGGLRAYLLAPWIGANRSLGIWAVPSDSGIGGGDWSESAHDIVGRGKLGWIRFQSDTKLGRYLWFEPKSIILPPQWPGFGL